MTETAYLPDGTPFPFWSDETEYRRIYHVACGHPRAADEGPGSEERPFATIGRAAEVLRPGEKVVVHEGLYRECVRPAHGGTGSQAMIAYEAAPGEAVCVCGSERWAPAFEPGRGWRYRALPEGVTAWTAELPAGWFVGYNPFIARNFSSEFTTFTRDWTTEEIHLFMLRRGMVFFEGRPLKQVFFPWELGEVDGVFWVEDPGLRLHLRLPGDADPRGRELEVTTREQAFAPLKPGLGYIRVSGMTFEHCADGIPVPQRAMVSAARGHHWIIEDCTVRWANACGIDVGNETWHRLPTESERDSGHHIIRRNYVADCGICGIAAVGNNAYTLVEDNTVERVAGKDIERIWETGGLKFHLCDAVLIRRNLFRHIRHAPALWLDYLNKNCRITGNVVADIQSIHGGVYLEVSHALNVIDHNVFWDIRGVDRPASGTGINVDTGEQCVVAHNLLGNIADGYAVRVNLDQKGRVVDGRVGLCRRHRVLNNVFVGCPKRVLFSRTEENRCEGNLYHEADDETSLCVEYPAPQALLNLAAWQTYYGYDRQGAQAQIHACLDPATLALSVDVDGDLPICEAVPELREVEQPASPGPNRLVEGRCEVLLRAGRPST